MERGVTFNKITIQCEHLDLSKGSVLPYYRLPSWLKDRVAEGLSVYLQALDSASVQKIFSVIYSEGFYKLRPEYEYAQR